MAERRPSTPRFISTFDSESLPHAQVREAHLHERLSLAHVSELLVEADGVVACVELDLLEAPCAQLPFETKHERASEARALPRRIHRHLPQLSEPRRFRREKD